MNKLSYISLLIFFMFTLTIADGLEVYLSNLNVDARADQSGFSQKISAQFGVSSGQVKFVLSAVASPADAFMVFQLGHMTSTAPEKVLNVYKTHKKKGWGAMAKQLGIKPGSAEFHALKNGSYKLVGGKTKTSSSSQVKSKGNGNGKSQGNKQGKK